MTMGPEGRSSSGTRDAGNVYAVVDAGNGTQRRRGPHPREEPERAERRGLPGRRAVRRRDLAHPPLRRHRERGSRARPRRSSSRTRSRGTRTTAGSSSRSGRTGSSTCRSARRATSASASDRATPSILRMKPDGSGLEIVRPRRAQHRRLRLASGRRRSCGSRTTVATGWATTPARRAEPRAARRACTSAFPYCHGGDVATRSSASERPCSEFIPPALKLGAHVAALGMRFYTGDDVPGGVPGPDLHRRARLVEPDEEDRLPRDARAAEGREAPSPRSLRRRAGCRARRPGGGRSTCSCCPTARCSSPTTWPERSTGSRTGSRHRAPALSWC